MKKEIFIIDDDPIYRMIVSKMIRIIDSSLPIVQCENGEIGLQKLEETKKLNHPVIILLDINMPILDGWGFLDEIEKSNIYDVNQFKIYLVSSSTDESDIIKSQKTNLIKGFYSKPLSRSDIEKIISFE